jgi:uncharacterized protein (DUF427 family)
MPEGAPTIVTATIGKFFVTIAFGGVFVSATEVRPCALFGLGRPCALYLTLSALRTHHITASHTSSFSPRSPHNSRTSYYS